MRHDSLKSEIKIAMATTRIQRTEANKFRAKAKALFEKAKAESDQTKQSILNKRGWDLRCQGMGLRSEANSGRSNRRYMHLAAALLNGRSYKQCEGRCESHKKPQTKDLAARIQPHLPMAERPHAEYIAEMWLKDGTLRLTYIREQGLVRLLSLDKQKATIVATRTSIRLAEQVLKDTENRVAATERWLHEQQFALQRQKAEVVKATETLDGLYERLAEQEAHLRHEQETLATKSSSTNALDDLFA